MDKNGSLLTRVMDKTQVVQKGAEWARTLSACQSGDSRSYRSGGSPVEAANVETVEAAEVVAAEAEIIRAVAVETVGAACAVRQSKPCVGAPVACKVEA